MNILGISGSERHAATALSVDGVIVAAAAEESFVRVPGIGYRYTGGYPLGAIDACLTRAGLSLDAIDRVVVVDDRRPPRSDAPEPTAIAEPSVFSTTCRVDLARALRATPTESIDPVLADARQLAADWPSDDLIVVVLSTEGGASGVFERRGVDMVRRPMPAGLDQLFCAAARVARSLGLDGNYPALEKLAALSDDGGRSERLDGVIRRSAEGRVEVNEQRLEAELETLRHDLVAEGDFTVNVRVQQRRQSMAAAFCGRVNTVLGELVADLAARAGVARVGIAGDLSASSDVLAAAAKSLGDALVVAPVPEPYGRAIGAAFAGNGQPLTPLRSLALGPHYSEQDIKTALENCRLDYLYEPDWSRLLARVSRLLSQGSIVAWFQEAAGFGPRSIGTRAILCDPSNRYARENVNRFLRHVGAEDPLPVAMTAAAARGCLAAPVPSPFVPTSALVNPESRERLRAALDRRGTIPAQGVTEEQSPGLYRLLEIHRERTHVPGLVNLALGATGEPAACTPRDAVRIAFSSAIDALVIGRFLLMKDYWLLRSRADS